MLQNHNPLVSGHMAAILYQVVREVFLVGFFFFPSSFGLYLTNLQGLAIPLTTFIIPCSKLSKCSTCHFKLNAYSWVSVSGLDCALQSTEINSIHRISLIFMISDVLAEVCSFRLATTPKRTFSLHIAPWLALPFLPPHHWNFIQNTVWIYRTPIRHTKQRKEEVYVFLNVIQGKVSLNWFC